MDCETDCKNVCEVCKVKLIQGKIWKVIQPITKINAIRSNFQSAS